MNKTTKQRFHRLIEGYERFITTGNYEALAYARFQLDEIRRAERLRGYFPDVGDLPLSLQFYEDAIREDLPATKAGRAPPPPGD